MSDKSIYIYKETSVTNVYTKIGATDYLADGIFVDAISNPVLQARSYRLSVLDTCGTESDTSFVHRTIHLSINKGVGQTWNLIWTPYVGFSYGSYNVYRGTSINNLTLLITLASSVTSYTDITAKTDSAFYLIEISTPSDCDPSRVSYGTSRSNYVNNLALLTSINEEDLQTVKVYPNPTLGVVEIDFAQHTNVTIALYNSFGEMILKKRIQAESAFFDLSLYSNGIYLLHIYGENERKTTRIVKY